MKAKRIKEKMKQYDPWSVFFAVLMSSKVWGFIPAIPEIITYGVLFIYVIKFFCKKSKFDPIIVVLLLYIPINLLMTDPPEIFKPWMRYGLFVLTSVCITSLLQSISMRSFRRDLFEVSLWLCGLLGSASFVCYFLGINFMQLNSIEFMNIEAGLFSGLINHSMMMGPIAGCGAVFMGSKAYATRKRIYLVLCLFCVGASLLSASRSAVMATIAGILYMLMRASKGSGHFLRIIMLVAVVGALTFPLWQGMTDFVVEKQTKNMQVGSSFSSRESKWNNRIAEFKNNPILGIGYVSVGLNTEDVDPQNGTVEPGSSWLAILSMTGIVGMVIMFIIFYSSFTAPCGCSDDLLPSILGVIVLMAAHMGAEGYIFSANSYLFFLIWLALACARDYKYRISKLK